MISTANDPNTQMLGMELYALHESLTTPVEKKVKVRHVILNTWPFGIINFLLGGARCGGKCDVYRRTNSCPIVNMCWSIHLSATGLVHVLHLAQMPTQAKLP